MSDTIRVLIASDYCLTRSSLRQLLKQVPEFQVVAETDMPKDLADAQFRHSPDAILLVPGIHEVRYPATLGKQSPQSRVVIQELDETTSQQQRNRFDPVVNEALKRFNAAAEKLTQANLQFLHHCEEHRCGGARSLGGE